MAFEHYIRSGQKLLRCGYTTGTCAALAAAGAARLLLTGEAAERMSLLTPKGLRVEAELLVLLSDIDGFYTADPHRDPSARLIAEVRELTPELLAQAGGKGSEFGTGGMKTKLHAAQLCGERGWDMVIMNGSKTYLLYDLFEGRPVGTRFYGRKQDQ